MPVSSFADATFRMYAIYATAAPAFEAIGLAERFHAVISAPVAAERTSQFLELCYANRTALPADVLEAAADIGEFASNLGFYGLSVNGRGSNMVAILRGAVVENEPAAKGIYLPPAMTGAEPPAE